MSSPRQTADLLARELDCTGTLLEILDQEYQALTRGDAERIEAVARDKQGHMQRLQRLLQERETLLRGLGLVPDASGMERLLETLDDSRLDADWQELRRLAARLQEQNEINGGIVALGQRQVRQALDLLTGRCDSGDTYGPAGGRHAHPRSQSLARA